jgi:hypothetical protein
MQTFLAVSMLHRLLDETPVPSLPDVQPTRPATPQPASDDMTTADSR